MYNYESYFDFPLFLVEESFPFQKTNKNSRRIIILRNVITGEECLIMKTATNIRNSDLNYYLGCKETW